MKYLIFCLFFFSFFTGNGQTLLADTTIFESTNGVVVRKNIRVFSGKMRLEVDTTTAAQMLDESIRMIESDAGAISTAALSAITRAKTVRRVRDYDAASSSLAGISAADSVAKKVFEKHLSGKVFEVDSAGIVIPAQVNPRAAGGYNLRINGENYRIDIFDLRWIRVRNFPVQGTNTDLWLYKGEYISFDGTYILRTVNGSNIRSAQRAPTTPLPAPKKTTKKKAKQ